MLVRGKGLLHLFPFAAPQDAIVDEHTGQLVTDRAMSQRRGHRRVHPTAQGAQDPILPNLLADLFHRRVDIGPHGPSRLQPQMP